MKRGLILSAISVWLLSLAAPVPVSGLTIIRETIPVSPVTVKKEIVVIQKPETVLVEKIPPKPVKVTYEYYPDRGVYFNSATRVWFWEENGGWHSGKRLPSQFKPLPPKYRLKIDSETPYAYHERHLTPKIVKREFISVPKVINYSYEYFPETQVYFNSTTRVWFWKENGTWHSGYRLPERFTPIAPKVNLVIDSDTPYVYHEHEVAPGIVKREIHPVVTETKVETSVVAPNQLHEYTYYPDAGVYFDPKAKQFLWMENGFWKVANVLPSYITVDPLLAESIILEEDVRLSFVP